MHVMALNYNSRAHRTKFYKNENDAKLSMFIRLIELISHPLIIKFIYLTHRFLIVDDESRNEVFGIRHTVK